MGAVPPAFLDIIAEASLETKEAMLEALIASMPKVKPQISPMLKKNATATKKNISNYVTFLPEIGVSDNLMKDLMKEAEQLNLTSTPEAPDKVHSQWLNSTDDPYIFGPHGHEVTHKAKFLDDFPAITELMKIVNDNKSGTQDMNSCLVSGYSTHKATLSLHADDEDMIAQDSAILTFSIGATRSMDFCSKTSRIRNPSPISTYQLEQGCLTVMKPGCQAVLKHRINGGVHVDGVSDIRFSFSFRKSASPGIAPDKSPSSPIPEEKPFQKPKRHINLVAGDSFTARLDADKLGKKKRRVVNIAKGGFSVKDVVQSLEEFVKNNDDVHVDKLFISVGTNDIQHVHHGVQHLKGPYINMIKIAKKLFPYCKIFCQSLLPLPIQKHDTVINVTGMNSLIFDVCSRERVYYLDVFHTFLNPYGYRSDILFPHNAKDIHPHTRGMGVLAKHYIYLIHSKRFNPLGY